MSPRRSLAAGPLDDAASPADRNLAEEFQERLDAGDWRQLPSPALRAVIDQAGAEPGLDDEIGVLRVVLARLLAEERDPTKLAAGAARIASVAVQAARARHALQGQQAENLTDAIAQILTELDGE